MVRQVKVWDPLVRIFHWSLVIGFFVAYFTEGEELLGTHVWAGYAVLGLVILRILWGFIGSQHARFSDFLYAPDVALKYAFDAVCGKAKRYIGHNPAGGLMIILLLLMLLATTVSGLAVYGADQHAGPFKGFFAGTDEGRQDDVKREDDEEGEAGEVDEEKGEREEGDTAVAMRADGENEAAEAREQSGAGAGGEAGEEDATEEFLEELHEILANLTVVLIVLHVLGVIVESRVHKENLVLAMFTGRKRSEEEFGA